MVEEAVGEFQIAFDWDLSFNISFGAAGMVPFGAGVHSAQQISTSCKPSAISRFFGDLNVDHTLVANAAEDQTRLKISCDWELRSRTILRRCCSLARLGGQHSSKFESHVDPR